MPAFYFLCRALPELWIRFQIYWIRVQIYWIRVEIYWIRVQIYWIRIRAATNYSHLMLYLIIY